LSMNPVVAQDALHPFVVLPRTQDEFHLIGFPEKRDVLPTIPRHFAGRGTLEIHDPADAPIEDSDVMGTRRLDQNRVASVTQIPHEPDSTRLEQWLAARKFNQRQPMSTGGPRDRNYRERPDRGNAGIGLREAIDLSPDITQGTFDALGEGVCRITVGTAEIAGGQPNENARQPREGALPLQAQINFVDDECLGHRARLAGFPFRNQSRTVQDIPVQPQILRSLLSP